MSTSLKNAATGGIMLAVGFVAAAFSHIAADAFMAVALGFGIRSWFD